MGCEKACTCGNNDSRGGHHDAAPGSVITLNSNVFNSEVIVTNHGQLFFENEIVEVRFKNNRKEFYRNSNRLDIKMYDRVVVSAVGGYDVGTASLVRTGAANKFRSMENHPEIKSLPAIKRKASEIEIHNWLEARKKEKAIIDSARTLAREMKLNVSILNSECRADQLAANIYYSSNISLNGDYRQGLMEVSGMDINLVNIAN
ncbi:MAG: hypothetical protein K9J30_12160 [Bacteroidales bacterium]|nr:hypothetical protein [Bacteroidales bacterium]